MGEVLPNRWAGLSCKVIEHSRHERGLRRVIVVGTTLSFGILGAIIGSMRDFVRGNAVFDFSYRTIIGFGLGAVAGWLLWRVVRLWIERDEKPETKDRETAP